VKIRRPNNLKINYKYTVSMPDINKSLHDFYDSIFNKHIDDLYNGKSELFISTIYSIGSDKYYQIDLDFDKLNSISEVRKLGKDLQSLGIDQYFFVQGTGNGYHVKSNFAVRGLDYTYWKNFNYFKNFKMLDKGASLRSNPSRAPWSYTFKNHMTNYTIGYSYLFKYNINEYNKKFAKIPIDILSLTKYKQMLYIYSLPIFFINDNDIIIKKLNKL